MRHEIQDLLRYHINPALSEHSGACELVDIDKNSVVSIRLTGGCKGCPGKQRTFFGSIKPFLLNEVAGIEDIVLVD